MFSVSYLVEVSPHARGFAPGGPRGRWYAAGLPARAGVRPSQRCARRIRPWSPRTRRGLPWVPARLDAPPWVSPHARGFTRRLDLSRAWAGGLPARAGVCPCRGRTSASALWSPRTRGGLPSLVVSPRSRWVVSPHARGAADGWRNGFG